MKSNVMNAFNEMEQNDAMENKRLNASNSSKSTSQSTKSKQSTNDTKSTSNVTNVKNDTLNECMTILSKFEIVTPSTLCKLFNMDDGGKLIRRHLRKNFATPCNHVHNQTWTWKNDDAMLIEIVSYFATRYEHVKSL